MVKSYKEPEVVKECFSLKTIKRIQYVAKIFVFVFVASFLTYMAEYFVAKEFGNWNLLVVPILTTWFAGLYAFLKN